MKSIEHDEQVKLFKWAKMQSSKHRELSMMFAIPNGGQRNIVTATKLKAEGVKSGVPDIMFPVARNGYNGVFIEMKSPKGKLSENQAIWINALKENGYLTYVCYSFDEAKEAISNYLSI